MAAFALVIAGCFEGAPRRHPLDPQGENFVDAGGLSVQATTFYAPKSGLPDATITVAPGSFIGQTDREGRVFIPDLPTGQYNISVSKAGYAPKEQIVDVINGETAEIAIALPGLPAFLEISPKTAHISRWWPPPEEQFQLVVDAFMEDPDGLSDITLVSLEIPALDFSRPLRVQNEPGRYALSLSENELSVSVATLLGRDIFLHAEDRAGTSITTDRLNLVRVIDQTPLAVSPQSLETLPSATPELTWESVSLNFPFTYSIAIFRVDNNVQNLAWSAQDISPDSMSIITTELPTGQYFWTVSVVDEFGNRSRSREAGFRIP